MQLGVSDEFGTPLVDFIMVAHLALAVAGILLWLSGQNRTNQTAEVEKLVFYSL